MDHPEPYVWIRAETDSPGSIWMSGIRFGGSGGALFLPGCRGSGTGSSPARGTAALVTVLLVPAQGVPAKSSRSWTSIQGREKSGRCPFITSWISRGVSGTPPSDPTVASGPPGRFLSLGRGLMLSPVFVQGLAVFALCFCLQPHHLFPRCNLKLSCAILPVSPR